MSACALVFEKTINQHFSKQIPFTMGVLCEPVTRGQMYCQLITGVVGMLIGATIYAASYKPAEDFRNSFSAAMCSTTKFNVTVTPAGVIGTADVRAAPVDTTSVPTSTRGVVSVSSHATSAETSCAFRNKRKCTRMKWAGCAICARRTVSHHARRCREQQRRTFS